LGGEKKKNSKGKGKDPKRGRSIPNKQLGEKTEKKEPGTSVRREEKRIRTGRREAYLILQKESRVLTQKNQPNKKKQWLLELGRKKPGKGEETREKRKF